MKKMAEQFEADFSEESEGQSLELMGTQVGLLCLIKTSSTLRKILYFLAVLT